MALNLAIYDAQGRVIQLLLSGIQPSGRHQVLLNGLELEVGHYFLSMESNSKSIIRPFVVKE
jgi:hypothetical protein